MAVSEITQLTRVLYALPNTCKTLVVLSEELDLTHRQVSNAAASLIRKGLVERIEAGCFRLTCAGAEAVHSGVEITSGPNAPYDAMPTPRRDTLRQRAWNAMRFHRSFTVNDLLMASTQGSERDAACNLQRYCKELSRAGVLRRMPRRVKGTRVTSNGFLRYQLLKDLGDIAPTIRASKGVLHDHNSGEEFSL